MYVLTLHWDVHNTEMRVSSSTDLLFYFIHISVLFSACIMYIICMLNALGDQKRVLDVGDCGPPDPEFPVNNLFSCACSCSEHKTGEWFLVGL